MRTKSDDLIKHTEHGEQAALIQWAKASECNWPELALLFAVPNGGHRSKTTALRLRMEGVKAGVSDLFLPVPRDGYHGFWIEMKVGSNHRTLAQCDWQDHMEAQGYAVVTCWGFDQAKDAIELYLESRWRKEVDVDEVIA